MGKEYHLGQRPGVAVPIRIAPLQGDALATGLSLTFTAWNTAGVIDANANAAALIESASFYGYDWTAVSTSEASYYAQVKNGSNILAEYYIEIRGVALTSLPAGGGSGVLFSSVNSLYARILGFVAAFDTTATEAEIVQEINEAVQVLQRTFKLLKKHFSYNTTTTSTSIELDTLTPYPSYIEKLWYGGSKVLHGGKTYLCILDHTSAATTEPGVGATWTTAWVLIDSAGGSGTAWALSTAYTSKKELNRADISVVEADVAGGNTVLYRYAERMDTYKPYVQFNALPTTQTGGIDIYGPYLPLWVAIGDTMPIEKKYDEAVEAIATEKIVAQKRAQSDVLRKLAESYVAYTMNRIGLDYVQYTAGGVQ